MRLLDRLLRRKPKATATPRLSLGTLSSYDELLREYYTPDVVHQLSYSRSPLLNPPRVTRWHRVCYTLAWPLRRFRAWLHRDCGGC